MQTGRQADRQTDTDRQTINTESEFSVILVIIVLGKDFLQALPFDDTIQYTLFYPDPYGLIFSTDDYIFVI